MDDRRYTLEVLRRNKQIPTRLNADALPEPNAETASVEFESNLRLGRLWAGICLELGDQDDVVWAALFDEGDLLVRRWVRS